MENGDSTVLVRGDAALEEPTQAREDSDQAVLVRGEAATKEPPLSESLGASVQAHLGRASKFADGKTRDWSVFFFFRILPQAAIDADVARLRRLWPLLMAGRPDEKTRSETRKALLEVFGSIKNPALMNAGLGSQGEKVLKPAGAAPSRVFLGLLAAIAKPSFDKTKDQWSQVISKVDEQSTSNISLASLPGLTARTGDERAELIRSLLRFVRGEQTPNKITELANNLHQYLTDLSLPIEINVDILTWNSRTNYYFVDV